jgi:hypothetical protein
MDLPNFISEWRGRRVDFNHDAKYLESDLIQEYLFECYGVTLDIDNLRDLYEQLPEAISDRFYVTNDPVVTEGDIVFLNDFTHAGIATGEQDMNQFELLEQNAVGSETGIGDDAIRTNLYEKTLLSGQLRARFKPEVVKPDPVTEPTPAPEPDAPKVVVQKPHKFAHGGLKVPLHRVEFRIVTQVPTYRYMSFAQTGKDPGKVLHPGTYYMTSQHGGMAKVDSGEGTESVWINPADNTLTPKVSPRKDTRSDWEWFDEARYYKATNGFMKTHKVGEVFSWKVDKPNAEVKYGQPVWIVGRFRDGEHLYGVPGNPKPDGSINPVADYGIMMSYLTEAQLPYEPDDLIHDVEPAAAVALVPREVTVKDNISLLKAHGQKLIDGFIKRY